MKPQLVVIDAASEVDDVAKDKVLHAVNSNRNSCERPIVAKEQLLVPRRNQVRGIKEEN